LNVAAKQRVPLRTARVSEVQISQACADPGMATARCSRNGAKHCMSAQRKRSKTSTAPSWKTTTVSWPITTRAVAMHKRHHLPAPRWTTGSTAREAEAVNHLTYRLELLKTLQTLLSAPSKNSRCNSPGCSADDTKVCGPEVEDSTPGARVCSSSATLLRFSPHCGDCGCLCAAARVQAHVN